MPIKKIREFIQLETSGGFILLATAVLALIFSNSPLRFFYEAIFNLPVKIQVGLLEVSKPLLLWVNEGLMTIFFLLVGLEIKREMFEGELNSWKKASLPAFAAIGGMIFPALLYFYFNIDNSIALRGWAIPTATDIAFSLGIIRLLGSRVPVSLKLFLTALAIFDDIGAIVIIAVFYTQTISLTLLFAAMAFAFLLFVLNRYKVNRVGPYVIFGIALWICVLKSGVHATLSGIIIAFAIPLRDPTNKDVSPLRNVEHKLHPWVAFGVLPLFAFANAGVSFGVLTWYELVNPITLGIAFGLFVGKQVGVWLVSWLSIKFGLARLPVNANMLGIYGIGLIAGVGFTMSLFIGSLAFGRLDESYTAMVRIGVMAGSLASGVMGYLILARAYPATVAAKRKRKKKKITHKRKKKRKASR